MMRRLGRAFRAFWKALRGKEVPAGTLREFVYLDETSVESLLASLDGEVLTGVTESRTRGHEVGIAATGDAVGVPTGLTPSFSRSRSVTVEEQRKSVAQSAFARFRTRHYRNLRLRAVEPNDKDEAGAAELRVPISNLHRGDLIEIDAKLGASDIFQVRAVIDSMIGVVDAYPDLIGASEIAAIRAAAPIGDLLGSLSQGLIPVEGLVADFRAVKHGDFEGIVSAATAAQLERAGASVRDVIVSGVSLEPLYWQDVRRVLFSNQTYRVLGRLVNTGARDNWSSLKITEVLSRVNSQIADTINALGPMFLSTLQQGVNVPVPRAQPAGNPLQGTLESYARAGAEQLDVTLTPAQDASIRELIESVPEPPVGPIAWRSLQTAIAGVLLDGEVPDPEIWLELRSQFPAPSEIVTPPVPIQHFATDIPLPDASPRGPVYLEVEIIAIYW